MAKPLTQEDLAADGEHVLAVLQALQRHDLLPETTDELLKLLGCLKVEPVLRLVFKEMKPDR